MDIGSVLNIASFGLSAVSTFLGAKKSEDQAEAQASQVQAAAAENRRISLYDASVADDDARATEYAAGLALRSHLKKAERLVSSQRARFAKAGVVVSSGSPMDVIAETAGELAFDAEVLRYEGQTRADRYRSLASRYRMLADAGLRDAAAQAALIEDAGEDRSLAYLLSGGAKTIGAGYELAKGFGWLE